MRVNEWRRKDIRAQIAGRGLEIVDASIALDLIDDIADLEAEVRELKEELAKERDG